jgi:hypothetical protein
MHLRNNISLGIESSAIFRLQAIFVFIAAHVFQALDSMRGSQASGVDCTIGQLSLNA